MQILRLPGGKMSYKPCRSSQNDLYQVKIADLTDGWIHFEPVFEGGRQLPFASRAWRSWSPLKPGRSRSRSSLMEQRPRPPPRQSKPQQAQRNQHTMGKAITRERPQRRHRVFVRTFVFKIVLSMLQTEAREASVDTSRAS